MESHLGNTSCFRCCSDFQIPSPLSLIFPGMSPGIWGVYSALAAEGREGSNLQGTLMPSMPCCGQSGPPLPTLAIAELWLLLFWGEWNFGTHPCSPWLQTFMCVPNSILTLFILTLSLWKLTHSFLNTSTSPWGPWKLMQTMGSQNLYLGLMHPNLSCSLPCKTASGPYWI